MPLSSFLRNCSEVEKVLHSSLWHARARLTWLPAHVSRPTAGTITSTSRSTHGEKCTPIPAALKPSFKVAGSRRKEGALKVANAWHPSMPSHLKSASYGRVDFHYTIPQQADTLIMRLEIDVKKTISLQLDQGTLSEQFLLIAMIARPGGTLGLRRR